MLGYLFQVRMALVLLLRRVRVDPGTSVTLENFDDIAFASGGNPIEQLQTKLVTSKNLTDASTDLWKTLRIWSEQFRTGALDPATTSLTLLTTAQAPVGSAAYYLALASRNHEKALEILEQVAQKSLNQSNKIAYEEFLRLSPKRRTQLLRSIYVLDKSPGMLEAFELLQQELRFATAPPRIPAFAKRLEGWWFGAVVEQLTKSRAKIRGSELDSEMADLREQFRIDNLPIDYAEDTIPDGKVYEEAKFVRQLQSIALTPTRISLAMLDYYRATRQRGRWIDDQMIHESELKSFETRLHESWLDLFEAEKQECDGTDKPRTGRTVYSRTMLQQILLRPNCMDAFVMRGSYHILADKLKVGWHPDFMKLLVQGENNGE